MIRCERNPVEDGFGAIVAEGVEEARSCAEPEAVDDDADGDVTRIISTIKL